MNACKSYWDLWPLTDITILSAEQNISHGTAWPIAAIGLLTSLEIIFLHNKLLLALSYKIVSSKNGDLIDCHLLHACKLIMTPNQGSN